MMRMTTKEWGGAMSTFDKEIGSDGKKIHEVFSFQTFGLSLDQAVELLKLPTPDFIKIDVDGIEHFILQAGPKVLNGLQGMLVEINENFIEQSDLSRQFLEASGLVMIKKEHAEMFDGTPFKSFYNQIWERK